VIRPAGSGFGYAMLPVSVGPVGPTGVEMPGRLTVGIDILPVSRPVTAGRWNSPEGSGVGYAIEPPVLPAGFAGVTACMGGLGC